VNPEVKAIEGKRYARYFEQLNLPESHGILRKKDRKFLRPDVPGMHGTTK
jgi:hypothetical protein